MARITPTQRQVVLEELARRQQAAKPAPTILSSRAAEHYAAFMASMHPKQQAAIRDRSKRKALRAGRRGGKTKAMIIASILAAMENDNSTVPYICLDKGSGRRNFWRPLKLTNQEFGLGISFNETTLTARLPNGCEIQIFGARDADEMEKLRGTAYPLVLIDEAGSFPPHLAELVEDVLDAAMGDLDGTIIMGGTCPKINSGFFFEAANGINPGWSVHQWDVRDNPYFEQWKGKPNWKEQAEAYLKETARRFGGWNSPKFQREQLANFVQDDDALVYKYDPNRNVVDALPEGNWFYVLCIDFGYSPDPTSINVCAFSTSSPDFYIIDQYEKTEMLDKDIADQIAVFEKKYGTFMCRVGDPAAKQFFMQLNRRYGTAIQPAEKTSKADWIEAINGDFSMGHIKILRHLPINKHYAELVWNKDKTAEDPRRPNHGPDAVLYGYRKSRHWAFKEPEAPRAPKGSVEYAVLEMQKYLELSMAGEKDPWDTTYESEF